MPAVPLAPYQKKVKRFGRPKRYAGEGKPVNKVVHIPAHVDAALMLFARQQDVNVSAYMRQLVVDDLVRRGYLKP